MASTLKHTVKKGDTLSKIARTYHILDWKTEIWNAPFNRELRRKTKDPNRIEPGWEVLVPVIRMPAGKLYAAVGRGDSLNRAEDVKTVRTMLNRHAESAGFKPVGTGPKAAGAVIPAEGRRVRAPA